MIIPTKLKIRGARLIAAFIAFARKCAGLQNITVVQRGGLNWSLDLREGIDFAIYLTGYFEPNTISSYKRILRNGDVAIDIGANIGSHTLHLANAVGPDGKVLAFEPTAEIFSKLKENLRLNHLLVDRVQAFQIMLREQNGMEVPKEIFARWPLKELSEAHPLHGGVAVSTEGAEAKTLDTMVLEHGIENVKLIKLDVDGFETEVLSGATETIERDKPAVIFEYSPYTSEEKNIDPNGLIDFFISRNYSFYELSGRPFKNVSGYLPPVKPGSGLNILALHR